MFEALKIIGEALSTDKSHMAEMEEFIRPVKKDTVLARVIFDFDRNALDCDCDLTCDENRAKEFLWVGNSEGNRSQLRLTTDSIKYLLNPKQGRGRKWSIKQILEEAKKRGVQTGAIKTLCQILEEIQKNFFKDGKERVSEFNELLQKKGIKPNKISLYTVTVRKNGAIKDLVKEAGYREFLKHDLEFGITDRYPSDDGMCHICGEKKRVLTNPDYPKGTPLIMYNIDKAGFLSGLSRSLDAMKKTHAVCHDCRIKLQKGLQFVQQNLRKPLGDLNVYIIPRITGAKLDFNLLRALAEKSDKAYSIMATYKALDEVERAMQEFRKEKELPFIYSINLLFGHKGKQSSQFVYQKMIQNVPVTRLLQIADNASELEKSMAQLFNEEVKKWSIKVNDVYQIFPKRGEEWKSFVELFSSMLNGTRYSRERVVKKALLYAKILRYRTETVYELKKVSDDRRREELMCRGLLKYAIFLKLLENIGVIKMNANEMLRSISGIEEDIKRFIEMQGFQEWQAGLFLLGTLLGNIGVEQYKKGDKKKSILDKVNFDGCSTEKVKYLANVALEGLKNYRILAHTEGTYAIMKEILDRNLDKLTNPVDNTYYILSGYAFITLRVITSGGERHE